uniref:MADS-box protein SOC1 n=1 Tax=Cajanus cajan TaxID=3821 RepID=A0A151UCC4_CAJCA|nr:MADS-box protein SOC1 [Cajanus cajan]
MNQRISPYLTLDYQQVRQGDVKFLGEGLGSCSIEELHRIEQQLQRSISNVRARKTQVFMEQIEELKEKEKALLEEKARLSEKHGTDPQPTTKDQTENQPQNYAESSLSSDVETELFIGLPHSRTRGVISCWKRNGPFRKQNGPFCLKTQSDISESETSLERTVPKAKRVVSLSEMSL